MSDHEPCKCHPECWHVCRIEEHPAQNPCIWPDCLTWVEMRDLLRDLGKDAVS